MTNASPLTNCKACGQPFFNSNSTEVCPYCLQADEGVLVALHNYLERTSRTVRLDELIEETKLSINSVDRLQRKGKLAMFPNLEVSCKCCKKPVKATSGMQFCPECYNELRKQINSTRKTPRITGNSSTSTLKTARRFRMNEQYQTGFKSYPLTNLISA